MWVLLFSVLIVIAAEAATDPSQTKSEKRVLSADNVSPFVMDTVRSFSRGLSSPSHTHAALETQLETDSKTFSKPRKHVVVPISSRNPKATRPLSKAEQKQKVFKKLVLDEKKLVVHAAVKMSRPAVISNAVSKKVKHPEHLKTERVALVKTKAAEVTPKSMGAAEGGELQANSESKDGDKPPSPKQTYEPMSAAEAGEPKANSKSKDSNKPSSQKQIYEPMSTADGGETQANSESNDSNKLSSPKQTHKLVSAAEGGEPRDKDKLSKDSLPTAKKGTKQVEAADQQRQKGTNPKTKMEHNQKPEDETKKEAKEETREDSKEEGKEQASKEAEDQAKEQAKEDAKEDAKKQAKEDAKEEAKEETEEEAREESQEEAKEDAKEEASVETKEVAEQKPLTIGAADATSDTETDLKTALQSKIGGSKEDTLANGAAAADEKPLSVAVAVSAICEDNDSVSECKNKLAAAASETNAPELVKDISFATSSLAAKKWWEKHPHSLQQPSKKQGKTQKLTEEKQEAAILQWRLKQLEHKKEEQARVLQYQWQQLQEKEEHMKTQEEATSVEKKRTAVLQWRLKQHEEKDKMRRKVFEHRLQQQQETDQAQEEDQGENPPESDEAAELSTSEEKADNPTEMQQIQSTATHTNVQTPVTTETTTDSLSHVIKSTTGNNVEQSAKPQEIPVKEDNQIGHQLQQATSTSTEIVKQLTEEQNKAIKQPTGEHKLAKKANDEQRKAVLKWQLRKMEETRDTHAHLLAALQQGQSITPKITQVQPQIPTQTPAEQAYPADETTMKPGLEDVAASNEREDLAAGIAAAHENEKLARQMVAEMRQQGHHQVDEAAEVELFSS